MTSLPVVETFHSLQGEGIHTGRSAFFIRLGGCAVACPWCDTKHSWPMNAHPERSLAELRQETAAAATAGAEFVVITGGEPLHHNLNDLCEALAPVGLPLHLETSGVDPLSGNFDWISLSPKRHNPPCPDLLSRCDELKLIIHEAIDLEFAELMAAATTNAPALLLQPGANSETGNQLAISYVLSHPGWRLSLQTHKWLGVR
jgi:organic radical activating enzyme